MRTCECGEFGGSEKTCPIHGYEGSDPDFRPRAYRGMGKHNYRVNIFEAGERLTQYALRVNNRHEAEQEALRRAVEDFGSYEGVLYHAEIVESHNPDDLHGDL